jgi:hypothetical protein
MARRKGKKSFMALNLDLEKAFDKMEWSFLINILHCLGFSPHQSKMIEECILTPSFSVLLNGSPLDFSIPPKDLDKGILSLPSSL